MSEWSYSGYLNTYDDFVAKLTELRQIDLVLEILEDRHGRSSTIVTSQVPIETWHEVIGNPSVSRCLSP